MSNFEKSKIYLEAKKKYEEEIFLEILKPLHSIIVDGDEVYLFYNQDRVKDIFSKIETAYVEENFPISLGYESPTLVKVSFMGVDYMVVFLRYDGCDVPSKFEAHI